MKNIIKVFIVDDHEIFRNGLKMIFNKSREMEIVGEADSGEQFLNLLDTINTDVVLMDIKMGGINGIETTRRALQQKPDLKILVLSTFGEEEFLEQILQAGAKGFTLKNVLKETLFNAIRMIHEGQNYFSPELLPYFTRRFMGKENQSDKVDLTDRELEVLDLIGKGLSNEEIAEKLFISKRTVDTHKNNLISKTGSKNIVSLLIYAIKHQLINIDDAPSS